MDGVQLLGVDGVQLLGVDGVQLLGVDGVQLLGVEGVELLGVDRGGRGAAAMDLGLLCSLQYPTANTSKLPQKADRTCYIHSFIDHRHGHVLYALSK